MTTHANSKVWQDVYRPHFRGTRLYVKLTVVAEDELLIVCVLPVVMLDISHCDAVSASRFALSS